MPTSGQWKVAKDEQIIPYTVGGVYYLISVTCNHGKVIVKWVTDGVDGIQDSDKSGYLTKEVSEGNTAVVKARSMVIIGVGGDAMGVYSVQD